MSDWRELLRATIERRLGLALVEGARRGEAERFAHTRATALGLPSVGAWLAHLEAGGLEHPELARLVRVVAVGHTTLHRDPGQLEAAVAAARRMSGRPVHVWCAACSTGEEVWSIAARLHRAGIEARVCGTDINADAVAHARRGRYPAWAVEDAMDRGDTSWLEPHGGHFQPVRALRRSVRFEVHNLVDGPLAGPGRGWDLVLCRNVLIYFTPAARQQVVQDLARSLHPDGWLFTGAAEILQASQGDLHTTPVGGRVAYQQGSSKPLPAPPRLARPPPLLPRVPPRPEPTHAAVHALLAAGRHTDAEQLLGRMLRAVPEDARAWSSLAVLRLASREVPEALEACAQAQQHHPLHPEVHYLEGVVRRKVGELDRAIAALRRALFLEPIWWPAAVLLAGAFERSGDRDGHRRSLRAALDGLAHRPDCRRLAPLPAPLDTVPEDPARIIDACRTALEAA